MPLYCFLQRLFSLFLGRRLLASVPDTLLELFHIVQVLVHLLHLQIIVLLVFVFLKHLRLCQLLLLQFLLLFHFLF